MMNVKEMEKEDGRCRVQFDDAGIFSAAIG